MSLRRMGPLVALFFLVAGETHAGGPDTAGIGLDQAEARFLQRNLQLLAGRLNVDASRAAIVQARLWNNPNLSIEQNIYNPQTKQYFDFTRDGNTEIQIQQLFVLAGKRGRQVHLAEVNADVAEQTMYDLLRSLRYELRTDFYDLFFLQQSLRFYEESVSALRRTVESTESILEKRSILLSEVLRVKSLLFSLENERLGVLNKANQIQWDLHVLLHDTAAVYYLPQVDRKSLDDMSVEPLTLGRLLELAQQTRPDLKAATANVRLAETTLALNKALAVPDVTVGGRWSRAGSYIPDYFAISVSVDLPIFNRNQGNILQAELGVEQSKALLAQTISALEKDVAGAYAKAVSTDRVYKGLDRKFTGQYQQLVAGMIKTFENRNISVIQFTDFFESYRTSIVQMNQLQSDRLDAFEAINYVVGTNILGPHQ
jgi:outer membrane protein, heavy metal efflux system